MAPSLKLNCLFLFCMDNNISAVDAFLFEDGFQCVITVLRLVIKHKRGILSENVSIFVCMTRKKNKD